MRSLLRMCKRKWLFWKNIRLHYGMFYFLVKLKEDGKTIILSTHIFSLAEKLCDRVGIIIDGKMVAQDSLESLCGGVSLEERFFEIYDKVVGER